MVLSRRLQQAVTAHWKHGPVELAMRYGEPSIESSLLRLVAAGIKRITLAPLYPQFADSTTTTVIEEAERVVREKKLDVQLSVLQPFYDQPEYLDALVASAKPYLQQDYDHLLLSFHGLPERHLTKLDPTGQHCFKNDECCRNASPASLATCYRAQCLRSAADLPSAWACRTASGRCHFNRDWAARNGSNPTPKRASTNWPRVA